MTDNEIIKALELCFAEKGTKQTCGKCPYHQFGELCKVKRDKDALDLINRQQAEISVKRKLLEKAEETINKQQAEIEHLEELYNERVNLCEEQDRQLLELDFVLSNYPYVVLLNNGAITTKNHEEYQKLLSVISAEAIKEFAERLKERLKGNGGLYSVTTMNAQVDNLVKETVGEE